MNLSPRPAAVFHRVVATLPPRARHLLKSVLLFALCLALLFGTGQVGKWIVLTVLADNTAQTIPFSQNWASTGLITTNDNWSGVAGIEGYLGQDITTSTGTDPQTLLGTSSVANDLDVIANQTNTAITNGGVAEFELTDPTIALNGSGTADAPYILIHLNTTGKSSIRVQYNLRDIDGTTDNSIQPVALQYRVGSSGNFTNVPAGFVADATTGPSVATLVTPVSAVLPAAANNQALVQIRIMTTNAVGNDEWVGVDDISITESTAPPTLSIDDVQVTEGDSGTKTATFTVSLSAVATSNVTFDIATQDNSATSASGDYVAKSVTGATIATPSQTYSFDVTINGDTDVESNETYFVNLTNATNATILDAQGLGTITNDDVVLTPIHSIQGSGTTSPLVGQSVSTRGIVIGIRSNGYYIQEPDATIDVNASTSEGIFVFTSSTPPAAAAIGALVQVTATVAEFIPSGDPNSPPVTELTSPTTQQVSTGNSLPTATTIVAADTPLNGTIEQLERFEGMRVTVDSLTVVAPTGGFLSEANATSTSDGVFFGVITGIARPFREAGIAANDPPPAGSGVTIPPVPRFDANPERIRVDSDALVGSTAINVTAGAVVTNLTGPLDYSFRTYTILQDPAITPGVSGNVSFTAVPLPGAGRFTVSSFNMQRFFDTSNDSGTSDVVLTATAFNNRLNKVSLAIRNVLRAPDIIGCVEVENLTTLQAIAAKINNDAVAASQPNPQYQAYLVEGNDPGGIDVGFLVSAARVSVVDVTQFGLTTTYTDPNTGLPATLNDRPPLVLRAVVQSQFGVNFPITVIANHLRSLNSIDDPTDGNRVRTKRRAQAEFLANLIQSRQTLDPNEKIISVGDYNAFQFNDGYVDLLGTIIGSPTAANLVTLASADLVTPNLSNLIDTVAPSNQYSYVFEGNAQVLDHSVITSNLLPRFSEMAYGRSNADFPEVYRTDPNRPERISDHDASVAYFTFPPCVLGCPGNVVANTDPGKNTAVVNYTAPSATDCGVVTCNFPSGSTFPLGPTLVTCTAATGDQCTFTVTVEDHENPVLTCPLNIARTIDGASDVVTFTPTATDNVGVTSLGCTPPSGSVFGLGLTPVNCQAKDAANNPATCSFNVTLTNSFVAQPSIVLSDPLECTGPGSVVSVNADIANPTAIPQTGTFQADLPSSLLGIAGSCVTNIGSCSVVNASTVTWSGTIPPGQTTHIAYKAQVADGVAPGTNLCVDSTATFNGTPNTVRACNVIDCPFVAPGLIPDSRSSVSDQRAGSVLFFNIHTSNAASPGAQNTRINLTNTHPELSSIVHLFMVEGSTCSISDFFVCLTPSGTTSFLTSEFDPGTTGYVVGVAVDRNGCPTNFNYLIGDEYVKFSTGHAANLGAEAFSAIAGGLPACNDSSVTAQLNFDGVSYTAVPRVLAVDNIPSRAEENETLLIVNRVGGNLGTGAATLSGLFGILYDDAEVPHSFNFSPGTCQFRAPLNNNFPRTSPRFENVIAAGKTGWMRFFSQNDQGLLGASINFNPNVGSSAGAFSQGHNLHKLRVTNGVSIIIPVFPPGC